MTRTAANRFIALILVALALALTAGPSAAQVPELIKGEGELDAVPYPLRPPDTSSPRATLRSFIRNMNDALQRFRSEESSEAVRRPLRRALKCLDLSQVPAATREEIGIEKALILKEVLDRIELPPVDEIPGPEVVSEKPAATEEQPATEDAAPADGEPAAEQKAPAEIPPSWTIPNTEITIAKVTEGPSAGAFLFDARTVSRVEEYYDLVQHLPYKPGATIGAYEDYLFGAGSLIPRHWVEGLPGWAYLVIADNPMWQWLGAVTVVGSAAFLFAFVFLAGRRWDRRFADRSAKVRFGKPLAAIVMIALTPTVSFLIKDAVNLTGKPLLAVELSLTAVRYAAVAWLVALLISRLGDGIINMQERRENGISRALIRIVVRLTAIVAVIYIAVIAAEAFGIPVAPLIAGLGVGGLAIALAVRPTLENIIGGFTLFADKPVKVGDFCAYGDKIGTVEQIGLRSTRVRSLDRTIVTIPNAEFSQMQLVNFAKRDMMLYKFILGLRYETTPDQLRYVLATIREMLIGHPKVTKDPARIRFLDFGAYSLDLEIFAYVRSADWGEYLGIREDLHLRIMDIVAEAGTGFAFPSQTNYFARDTGLDLERGRTAEERVEEWRTKSRLPFPEFDKGLQWEMEDILDFPPRGSPGHTARAGLDDPPPPQPAPPPAPAAPPKRSRRWSAAKGKSS